MSKNTKNKQGTQHDTQNVKTTQSEDCGHSSAENCD